MSDKDWQNSTSAPTMLTGVYLQDPKKFKTLTPVLHRYFLACCWKHKEYIPQQGIRDGLTAASKWIDGEITEKEFWRLERGAEAEAFRFENVSNSQEVDEVKTLINSIKMLKDAPYDISLSILKKAAYFANSAMVYPTLNTAPFDEELCTSRFLCADLLREFLAPRVSGNAHKGSLDIVAQSNVVNARG